MKEHFQKAIPTLLIVLALQLACGLALACTPPCYDPERTPTVTDDGDYTTSLTQLHFTWSPNGDAGDTISSAYYAIGTQPYTDETNCHNVRNWTPIGTNQETTATGLTLTNGVTYYISVRYQITEGCWSVARSSNGITTDNTAPSTPAVTDMGYTQPRHPH